MSLRGARRRYPRLPALAAAILVGGGSGSSGAASELAAHFASVSSMARPLHGRSCRSLGSGLALGDGLVLTAAHVLLNRADLVGICGMGRSLPDTPIVDVEVAPPGRRATPATVVFAGSRTDKADGRIRFDAGGDYALLRVARGGDPVARLVPCQPQIGPGRRVVVLLADRLAPATMLAGEHGRSDEDAAFLEIDAVFANGTSGAGVLDAESGCVVGVISHRFPEPAPRLTRVAPVAMVVDAWRRAAVSGGVRTGRNRSP